MTHEIKKDDLSSIRARALAGAGRMAWFEADFPTARMQLEESLALFRQTKDRVGMLDAMSTLILVRTWQGELAAALSLLEEGMALLRELPDRQNLLPVLAGLGRAAAFTVAEEALPHAWVLGEEAVRLARAANDKRSLAWALNTLAICCYYRGDHAAARPYLEEGVVLFQELGELWGVSLLTWCLGNVARRAGRYEEAWTLNQQSMTVQPPCNNRQGMPPMLESFAYLAVEEKQPQRAARLLAAAGKLREIDGNFRQPLVAAEYEEYLGTLRTMLDATEFEAAWEEGRAMTIEEVVASALKKEQPDATAQ